MARDNSKIVQWSKDNVVRKTVQFNKNNELDSELLSFVGNATQDASFNRYVKTLIAEDGGFNIGDYDW